MEQLSQTFTGHMRLFGLLSVVALSGCHVHSQTSSATPSAPSVSVLRPASERECPDRLRGFRNCLLSTEGFSLALESITPMPPARVTFGQPIVARVRYASRVHGLRIMVQPSNAYGCAAYDWPIEGLVERVPAGTGTVERTLTIRSANVRSCGRDRPQIQVNKNGEVLVERIRLVMGPPADSASHPVYDPYLMADFRFGP